MPKAFLKRRALVTGASEGIGRSFSKRLAKEGYTLTVVARNKARLEELVAELGGPPHSYLVADLTKPEDIQNTVLHLTDLKYNLLINNAGGATYGPFCHSETQLVQKVLALNCESLLRLSHGFLGKATAGDSLINISSTASYLPMPVASVYTASKAFVTSLSESLWFEERKRGVFVMAICPGLTATNFHRRAGGLDTQIPSMMSQTPDQVVDLAWRKLKARKHPVTISGSQKYLVWLSRFLPRRWIILLAGKLLDRALEKKI